MSESVMRGKVSDRFRCCFSGETQCFSLKLRGKQERLLSRALTRTCHLSSSFARSKGLNKFCEIKFHFILLISVRPSLPSTPIPISRQIRHPLNRTVLVLNKYRNHGQSKNENPSPRDIFLRWRRSALICLL